MRKYLIMLVFLFFALLQFPQNYQRVISLVPSITREIYLLQADGNLVACTTYCVVPKEAKTKEKVGDVLTLNLEKIVLLKPDLIIAADYLPAKYLKAFKQFGIRVESFKTPDSVGDIFAGFKRLGVILSKESEAEKILKAAGERILKLKINKRRRAIPRVCLLIGTKPLYWAAGESFLTDCIELAGGVNILKKYDKGLISREAVISLKPEVIILVDTGAGTLSELKRWKEFKSVPAVKTNRIFLVDPNRFCLPGVVNFIESTEQLHSLFNN
jgi:iron complex transport system substrate-binding protein